MSHFAAAMKSPLPVAASAAAATGGDGKSPLFCPKPRRPVAPLRCHHDMDLLDLLLSKGEETLFCGSPPRRASNPVVHDSRFGLDCPPMPAWSPAPPVAPPVVVHRPTPRPAVAMPMSSPRGSGGCTARARLAFQPAAVRVEGFDCLDGGRGGRGHGITAMA
ncbi:uncharacterized protein LOC127757684 [Oryza glaberrima]|uniref:Uncharacterized protein n=1 Tax=Oryza nivara TaxID=4536 RepID=A0A0E0JC30_ORYNI|nr:uncharacterized protein LOC127757684 [Oryza glaberrima]